MYKSFLCAVKGIETVFREERNFKIEVAVGLCVLVSGIILDFLWIERALLTAGAFMVITAEIINTVVEDLCDKVQPVYDPVIGKIKDMMAAYVLISVIGAVVLGLLVYMHHFFQ